MEIEPSFEIGQQQYEVVRSENVNVMEYDLFKRLADASQDFKMIVNKETLTQIIHCFQENANTQIKQYFEKEFATRVPMMMEAIQNKYNSVFSQMNSIQTAYDNEMKRNQLLQEQQSSLDMKYQQLKQQELEIKNNIYQIENELNSFDEKVAKRVASYDHLIQKVNAEKQRKQDEITKVIEVHNSITDEYNKLSQALSKYKQAYAKIQQEIQMLENGH